jgi:hypothetical protein
MHLAENIRWIRVKDRVIRIGYAHHARLGHAALEGFGLGWPLGLRR